MKTQKIIHSRGFSLIEMLAVITILVILAAVVIGGTSFVKNKQANETAKVQIQLLSAALEQYKMDNGTYPTGATGGKRDTKILYRALYWDSDDNGAGPDTDRQQKIYLSELDPDNNKQGWTDGARAEVILLDPWGNEYYFRSGKMNDGSANPEAINPDFDLWSAGPDGKTSLTGEGEVTKDDIRNWGS
jgi:prepilin-type N-terminal cleavage/methylation domain-containing protein